LQDAAISACLPAYGPALSMLSYTVAPPDDMTDHRSLMDDLTGRLEVLLRLYAAADDNGQRNRAKLAQRFRRDLRLLVIEYGLQTVDTALEKMPDEAWPSVLLH
jgi:hypothetical protein